MMYITNKQGVLVPEPIKLKISTQYGTWKVKIKSTPKTIMQNVFNLVEHDLKYMSEDAIVQILDEAHGMIIDCLEDQGRKSWKQKKQREDFLCRIEGMDRGHVNQYVYIEILRITDLSPLRGFSTADSKYANPEKHRISKKHPETEDELMYHPMRRTKMAKITKKAKVAVAKELNTVLGLDPALDVKSKTLDAGISEAAALIDLEEDTEEFTTAGIATLEAMGVWPDGDDGEEEEEDGEEEEKDRKNLSR